jgi:putative radical SAM enzyme (TIGR03279 family)
MYEFAVTPAVTQLRRPGVTITEVEPGSLGEELELRPGDRIVRVNGKPVRDHLDFRYQTAGETDLLFEVRRQGSEPFEIEFDREESEPFGLMFEQIVPRQCANECLFCFCKGNPEDARPSLFVRDEDIRLSFLYGNYTTLSSITEDEMNRVIEQRLSPQYVSVHATDLKTRAYLLGVDEKRADISEKLKRLIDNGIEIHAQVVLCPGINDGAILERTLNDLAAYYPSVVSVAIVPVALTRYNTDERLTRVTPEFCSELVAQVSGIQGEFRQRLGTTFAFLGDEIYLKAGMEVPPREHYGDYPQIEDGVGMVRTFSERFDELVRVPADVAANGGSDTQRIRNPRINKFAHEPAGSGSPKTFPTSSSGTFITGEMFAPILSAHIANFNERFGTRFHVIAAPNKYFGGDVSAAGLLSGSDILAMSRSVKGDFVVIPGVAVKSDEPVLIDGMQFSELQNGFDVPVYAFDNDDLIAFFREARDAAQTE